MIFLVNPPNPPGKVSNKDMMGGLGQLYKKGGAKVPPIDLPYTAACLREAGISFHVIDCLGLDYDVKSLVTEMKKMAGGQAVSAALRTSLPTFPFDMDTAKKIKEETHARIIIFGPYVSLNLQATIDRDYIDVIVLGEPEFTFVDIFTKGLAETEGIWYRDKKGNIIRNNPRETIQNLDQLPMPEWESMPYKTYILSHPQFPDENPFLPVLTSRGCPFSCSYCPYPLVQGSKWRKRSPENVLEELAFIVKTLGIKNILFRDPEFTLDKKRILQICQGITSKKLDFHWRCETRIDTLDEELIRRMANAGCCGINLGIESSSEETLSRMGRKAQHPKQNLKIIKLCRELNIHTFCFFIIGLPGDKKRDLLKTIRMAKAYDCSQIQFTFAIPYPKTPLFQWAEENNFIEERKLDQMTGYVPVMRNEHLSINRLKRISRFVNKSVQMRKSLRRERIDKYGAIQRIKEIFKGILLWFEKWII
jgi:radical SAM superfamily enzyme YgiQ (UPF0313 family)